MHVIFKHCTKLHVPSQTCHWCVLTVIIICASIVQSANFAPQLKNMSYHGTYYRVLRPIPIVQYSCSGVATELSYLLGSQNYPPQSWQCFLCLCSYSWALWEQKRWLWTFLQCSPRKHWVLLRWRIFPGIRWQILLLRRWERLKSLKSLHVFFTDLTTAEGHVIS